VELLKALGDPLHKSAVRQKPAKCARCGGESTRYPHTRVRELADHLPKRGVLPANAVHIAHAEFFEWNNETVVVLVHGLPCAWVGGFAQTAAIRRMTIV